jgi:pimeloyl-ACP methyl ester carboxylesterase
MRPRKILGTGLMAAAGVVGGLVGYSALAGRRAERLVPRDGRFVEVDGARLHYVDIGSGPAILLVHGLSGQLRNFTYALTERLAGDYRVVAVDRPGSGYSIYTRPGGRGLHAQAAIIGRFIAAVGLDRPLLVGHSLGGALALTLATQSPKLLGGLALISPLTQKETMAPDVFKALIIPSPGRRLALAWTLAAPLGRLRRSRMLEDVFGPDPVPEDFGTRGGSYLSSRPGAIYAASIDITEAVVDLEEVINDYRSITLPVGILFGRSDRLLSPELHGERTAAAIPGAEIKLIDGGHMIPLTAPEETAAWIRAQAARIVG